MNWCTAANGDTSLAANLGERGRNRRAPGRWLPRETDLTACLGSDRMSLLISPALPVQISPALAVQPADDRLSGGAQPRVLSPDRATRVCSYARQ
jgi:hypothetical protein